MIKRYGFDDSTWQGVSILREMESGEWVKYSDIEPILKELEAEKKAKILITTDTKILVDQIVEIAKIKKLNEELVDMVKEYLETDTEISDDADIKARDLLSRIKGGKE